MFALFDHVSLSKIGKNLCALIQRTFFADFKSTDNSDQVSHHGIAKASNQQSISYLPTKKQLDSSEILPEKSIIGL